MIRNTALDVRSAKVVKVTTAATLVSVDLPKTTIALLRNEARALRLYVEAGFHHAAHSTAIRLSDAVSTAAEELGFAAKPIVVSIDEFLKALRLEDPTAEESAA